MRAHIIYTPEDHYVTFVWGGGYIDVYTNFGVVEGEIVGDCVDCINVYDYNSGGDERGSSLDGPHANDTLREFEHICDEWLRDRQAEEDEQDTDDYDDYVACV